MFDGSFALDGIDAKSVGIKLAEQIKFAPMEPAVTTRSVLGRNGDLVLPAGSYKNRKGSAAAYVLGANAVGLHKAAADFLLKDPGTYRELTTSTDPDHYWMARVVKGPEMAFYGQTLSGPRTPVLNGFRLLFDCKPQRFLKSGKKIFRVTQSGTVIQNPGSGDAAPLVHVMGSGGGDIIINGQQVRINTMTVEVYLDFESGDAYRPGANLNNTVYTPNGVYPVLKPGANTITFTSNIKSLEITPRWWDK